ncbi:M23 family metallopeptidase [Candidatus Riflebacteria bacterium]
MSRIFILLFLFLTISVFPVTAATDESSGGASGAASSASSMEDLRLSAEVQQVVDEFIDNLADSIKEKAKKFAREKVAFSLYFVKHYMEKKKALKKAIVKTADFVVQTTISEFEKLERSNPEKLSEVSSEAEKAKENAKKKKADAKEKKETGNKKTTTVIQEGGAKQVDATGKVLKEIVTKDGEQVAYEYEYDENGKETGQKKVDASQYMTDGKYHFRSDEMVKETKGEVFKPESETEEEEATGTASGESGTESSGDSSDSSGDASEAGSSAGSAASGGSAGANAALGLKPYSELTMGEKLNRAEAEAVIVKLDGWADADAGIAGGAAGGAAGGSGDTGGETGGSGSGTGGDSGTGVEGGEDDGGATGGGSGGSGDTGGDTGGSGTGTDEEGDDTGTGDGELGTTGDDETGEDKPGDSTDKSDPAAVETMKNLEKKIWSYLDPSVKDYKKAGDAIHYAKKKLNEYRRDNKLSDADRKMWWTKVERWNEKLEKITPATGGSPFGSGKKYPKGDGYGYRMHPIKHKYLMHYGVDISAPWGAPLCALGPGTVTYSDYCGGAGYMIVIKYDNGYTVTYMHMDKKSHLGNGDRVKDGEQVGEVDSSGGSTGPHLHLEVKGPSGNDLDPEKVSWLDI